MMMGIVFVCAIVYALSYLSIIQPIILSLTFGYFLGNYAKFNWPSTTRLQIDNIFKTIHYLIKALILTIIPIMTMLHIYVFTEFPYYKSWVAAGIMTIGIFVLLMVSHLLIVLLTRCCKFKKPIYHMTFDQRMIWVLSKMSYDVYSTLVLRFIAELFDKFNEHYVTLPMYNMILISNLVTSPLLVWFSHRYSRKIDENLAKFSPEDLKQDDQKLNWFEK